jgi:hypothetical protein
MIRSLRHGAAIACLAASFLAAAPSPAEESAATRQVQEAINGILARSEAIIAIQVRYQYRGTSRGADGSALADYSQSLRLTVQGLNWILRYVDSPNFRLRRNDATLNYTESIGAGRDPIRSLHIEAPVPLRSLTYENAAYAATRLGTLWFMEQAQFLRAHREKAIRQPDASVDNIKTIVLDWDVGPPTFGQAMLVIPPKIAQARRGTLRLHTAPELNYALPCIEYLTPQGEVELQIKARNFAPAGNGIYFPHDVECTTSRLDGIERNEFRVQEISLVNEVIPDAEFALKIPQGTRVRDSRPGVPTSIFNLESRSQRDNVDALLAGQAAGQTTTSLRWTLLAVNLTFLTLSLLIWSYRRCRSG